MQILCDIGTPIGHTAASLADMRPKGHGVGDPRRALSFLRVQLHLLIQDEFAAS
jgi:hypothetical protein